MNSLIDQCVKSTLVWNIEKILFEYFVKKYIIGTSLVNIVLIVIVALGRVTHGITVNIKNLELGFDCTVVYGINLTSIGIEN